MSAPQIQYPPTASGGAPVGGSGTSSPSTIPRWTGASTLGDSIITQSGSFIGIGTASPSFKLEVAAGTASAMRLVSDSGTATVLRLLQTANRDWGIRIPASSTSLSFYDYSAGQERMVIDLNGNVGIGTASPASILHVQKSTAAGRTVLTLENSAAANTSNRARIRLGPSSGFLSTDLHPYVEGYCEATVGEKAGLAFGVWNGTAQFEAARIDSSGNFILNTATTGATIQAAGSQQGLKLPATPGNADTQTLDAYKENTSWSPTVTWGTGGTVTTTSATGAYTQIGNVVTFTVTIAYNCSVIPTGGSITMDLPRTSATGFNQRPGLWAFNAWNGVAGSNFLSIGSASTTATLRVANATGTADIATYLTVTASGALVITATYLAS